MIVDSLARVYMGWTKGPVNLSIDMVDCRKGMMLFYHSKRLYCCDTNEVNQSQEDYSPRLMILIRIRNLRSVLSLHKVVHVFVSFFIS